MSVRRSVRQICLLSTCCLPLRSQSVDDDADPIGYTYRITDAVLVVESPGFRYSQAQKPAYSR
jgi:hypothetical protein